MGTELQETVFLNETSVGKVLDGRQPGGEARSILQDTRSAERFHETLAQKGTGKGEPTDLYSYPQEIIHSLRLVRDLFFPTHLRDYLCASEHCCSNR